MKSFVDYISRESVLPILIRKRATAADKRHKSHYVQNIAPRRSNAGVGKPSDVIFSLMPPRRSWVVLNRNQRYQIISGEFKQRISTIEYNKKAIKLTIERDMRLGSKKPYLANIEAFIAELKRRVKDSTYQFSTPELFPKLKSGTEMRPITQFTDIYDSIIIILLNRYLTKLFDPYFKSCSFAFRAKRKDGITPSHHDAIRAIRRYRSKYYKDNIFVAECDMQKFYDTVDHQIVLRNFMRLLKRASIDNPRVCFEDISRLFSRYLDCYSFPRDVFSKNGDASFWREKKCSASCFFGWPYKELLKSKRFGSEEDLLCTNLGVPQGGALSGLIANIVLDYVDQTVLRVAKKDDLYLRYCDDMILLTTNRRRGKKLFSIYNEAIKEMRLVPHSPEEIHFGRNTNFWKTKTKNIYEWAIGKESATEWIGFVGYEIKRTGEIRVRKGTIQKEARKQLSVINDDYLNKIRVPKHASNQSLIQSIVSRLIAMSVGKICLWNADLNVNEKCWLVGFRELCKNKYLDAQMKYLDRMRDKAINYAKRKIGEKGEYERIQRHDIGGGLVLPEEFYGSPFSYYYQCRKLY